MRAGPHRGRPRLHRRVALPIPPPIDPRQLAAEVEATVSEFNRLTALAISMGVQVRAEIHVQPSIRAPDRPVLMVQVIAP